MSRELDELKRRYERRLLSLRAHRTDVESTTVLRQIEVVEALLRRIEDERRILRSLYEDDNFNARSVTAIAATRKNVAKLKEQIVTLGFEQYIKPDKIDHE